MRFKYFSALVFPVLIIAVSLCFAEQPKMTPEQEAAMKAWMDFATPGAPHKALLNMVGTWEASFKSYDPSAPSESKGTSAFVAIMDGRYLQETIDSTFNGMPFKGMGIYGYDNLTKKYVGTWIDSMGTGILFVEGASNDGGKSIEWKGRMSDPMSGKQMDFRSTMKMVTQDQYAYTMFGPGPDGKEMKMMDITYNRKK